MQKETQNSSQGRPPRGLQGAFFRLPPSEKIYPFKYNDFITIQCISLKTDLIVYMEVHVGHDQGFRSDLPQLGNLTKSLDNHPLVQSIATSRHLI